jgi:hypothetical protein
LAASSAIDDDAIERMGDALGALNCSIRRMTGYGTGRRSHTSVPAEEPGVKWLCHGDEIADIATGAKKE